MTLNCSGVRLDNRKVFCTPGPLNKPFERIFRRSINNNNIFISNYRAINKKAIINLYSNNHNKHILITQTKFITQKNNQYSNYYQV